MKITKPVVVHCPLTRPRAGVSCVLERVRRPASLPGIYMARSVLFASVGVRSVRKHPPVHACMHERERERARERKRERERESARTQAFMRSAHTH